MSEYEPILPLDVSVRFPAMRCVWILASTLDPPMALTYSATIFSGFGGVSAAELAGTTTARTVRTSQTARQSLISKRLHGHQYYGPMRVSAPIAFETC
jgi:hypothetical protein